jgi:Flp pilus assembly protein TadG
MSRKAGSKRRSRVPDTATLAHRAKPSETTEVASALIRHLWPFRLRLSVLRDDEGGVTLVLTAIMMIMLFGFVGLGLDAALWYTNHNQMQVIVDSAALGAAKMLSNSSNTTAMITEAAKNDALVNGLSTSTGDTISASVGSSPATVTVTMTRVMPTFFSALFLSAPTVSATATAAGAGTNVQVCILVLGSGSQTLVVNSGNTLTMPACQIDVASTNSQAAIFNSSLPHIAGACVAGSSTTNGNTVNNLVNQCPVAADPFANTIPTPLGASTCTVNGANYSGTTNLSPGTYCGSFNFNGSGTVTLAAGTYVFNDAYWGINSGWTVNGTGVTIYLANSSSYIQFGGGVTVNLSAPTSGTYANVLMFEPNGLGTSSFTMDGSSNSHLLQGLVYLPSREITFNSAANVSSDGMTLVVNELILDNVTWSINPDAKNILAAGSSSATVGLTN